MTIIAKQEAIYETSAVAYRAHRDACVPYNPNCGECRSLRNAAGEELHLLDILEPAQYQRRMYEMLVWQGEDPKPEEYPAVTDMTALRAELRIGLLARGEDPASHPNLFTS